MDRQAGFLLALLFLANFLTIEADDASGSASQQRTIFKEVSPGSPWTITCKGLDPVQSVVDWTRDGKSIGSEITSGELTMTNTSSTSTISATSAIDRHMGLYKCTPESADPYFLRVISDSSSTGSKATPAVSSNASVSLFVGEFFALAVNATIDCNATSGQQVHWYKNNKTLEANKDHYELLNEGKTIIFRKRVKSSYGNYSCAQGDSPKTLSNYRVIEMPTVALHPNSSVVEGEKFTLTCTFTETTHLPEALGASISWIFNKTLYTSSNDRVNLSRDASQGLENAKITITNMNMDDHWKKSGPITCIAKYKNMVGQPESSGITYLVVKDKLAALWPFLGICLEVVVLCAIILVYEKKRNKAELEESDTDQSPDTKPTPNKDSEVRHRK